MYYSGFSGANPNQDYPSRGFSREPSTFVTGSFGARGRGGYNDRGAHHSASGAEQSTTFGGYRGRGGYPSHEAQPCLSGSVGARGRTVYPSRGHSDESSGRGRGGYNDRGARHSASGPGQSAALERYREYANRAGQLGEQSTVFEGHRGGSRGNSNDRGAQFGSPALQDQSPAFEGYPSRGGNNYRGAQRGSSAFEGRGGNSFRGTQSSASSALQDQSSSFEGYPNRGGNNYRGAQRGSSAFPEQSSAFEGRGGNSFRGYQSSVSSALPNQSSAFEGHRGVYQGSRNGPKPRHVLLPTGYVVEVQQETKLGVTEADKEMFSEDIQKQLAEQKMPRRYAEFGFAPGFRPVDDIYKEDAKYADNYASIIDEDEDIHVEGVADRAVIDDWKEANFSETLMDNIKRSSYLRPRRMQSAVIPLILEGLDVTVQAETGCGKTAAFLLPIIDKCIVDKRDGRFQSNSHVAYAVILGPTRELVKQCYEQACKLASGTGVTVGKAYGEYTARKNQRELIDKCDIVCATPGRFLDFVRQRFIKLGQLKFLVFDEGDKLVVDNFSKEIDDAIQNCDPKINVEHQTLFFSATFDSASLQAADKYLKSDKGSVARVTNNRSSAPSKKCEQEFIIAPKNDKFKVLLSYFENELKKVQSQKNLPRTFIFCRTREWCEKVALSLDMNSVPCLPLSGMRGQDLREAAFNKFRDNEIAVLVVTDVCSRGIDIKDVDLVMNFGMPEDLDSYIHRIGRAGRIRNGKAITIVDDSQAEKQLLEEIKESMKKSGQPVPESLDAVIQQLISKSLAAKDDKAVVGTKNSNVAPSAIIKVAPPAEVKTEKTAEVKIDKSNEIQPNKPGNLLKKKPDADEDDDGSGW